MEVPPPSAHRKAPRRARKPRDLTEAYERLFEVEDHWHQLARRAVDDPGEFERLARKAHHVEHLRTTAHDLLTGQA